MRPPRPSRLKKAQPTATPADDLRDAAILAVVRSIPRGRVTTYGQVAARAGLPRQARLVGRVLSRLPVGSPVPWQRVVAAGGRIAFPEGSPAFRQQLARLQAEGVTVQGRRISLARHGWGVPDVDLDRWLWDAANATQVRSGRAVNTYDAKLRRDRGG